MRQAAVELTARQREAVAEAIHALVAKRGWLLHALNVRTNHVHVVVTAAAREDAVLHDLKAFATRFLRQQQEVGAEDAVWSRGGSARILGTRRAAENAVHYVIHEQGEPLGIVGHPL